MKAMKLLSQGEGVLHQPEPDIIEDAKEFEPTKIQEERGKSVNEREGLDKPIKITTISGEIQLESDDVKGLNETLDKATIRKKKASIGIESNSNQKVTSQLQGDTLIEQATDAEFSSPKS